VAYSVEGKDLMTKKRRRSWRMTMMKKKRMRHCFPLHLSRSLLLKS
jgi:hypothetical protein